MKKLLLTLVFLSLSSNLFAQSEKEKNSNPPIYIAFLWHMHQPLYWPGETILETQTGNYYPYSVFDIHNQRTGPYTSWPKTAVQKGIDANLPHAGASVSFSGSLIENLNHLEANGNGNFNNWTSHWNSVINQTTTLGNPRMDMIGFGYYHPLMGLIEYDDIRSQIQKHKAIMNSTFDGTYSKGIFPPENAFSLDMIPALKDEGLEWVLVDNIHFERASEGYPYNTGGNLYEPNKADVRNPDPGDWVQLNNLWAPTKISAQWGHQPHYVEYTDPKTGETSRIIAVPTERYMGNEDGRGGFGALQYESVMSQIEAYNTDPDHPILIVLHHDGDNFGGGSEGYYNGNFQAFVDWAKSQPNRFVPTTIQDYLDMFPPDENDVIHVESGSWAGADNGDPEFKKWLGDPGSDGYSPDRNSWGVVTAAKNFVEHAEVSDALSADYQEAQTLLLNAQASDYWYWDNSIDGVWDTHPTTASNLAIAKAKNVLSAESDITPPTIFKPQREPYNPGGVEWTIAQDNDFKVWTYVFDVNGLETVTLNYRAVSETDFASSKTTMFSQISESDTSWKSIEMTGKQIVSKTNIAPSYKAEEFTAQINGYNNTYIEYYVESEDTKGNTARSLIQAVWVGANTSSGGGNNGGGGGNSNSSLTISPENPASSDSITITISGATQNASLHWGVNNQGNVWTTPDQLYWPEGSVLFNGSGPAIESPFDFNQDSATLTLKIGPFNKEEQSVSRINFVIHYADDSWDNNGGNDYLIDFGGNGGGGETNTFIIDGNLDENATLISSNNGLNLYVQWQEPILYIATEAANSGANDKFILISDGNSSLTNSPWNKAGQVAQWGAFLANEQSNNYQSWFDQTGTSSSNAGAYLEGSINIEQEFGSIPDKLYLTIAEYGTNNSDGLMNQSPAGNGNGNIEIEEFYEFTYEVISVNNEEEFTPGDFRLLQNYPNPFNPSTEIAFQLARDAQVTLTVYDMLGRKVQTLVNGRRSAGFHVTRFDASALSSGVYFYRLESGNTVIDTKKMLLLK
ncbi:MAG: T9SS type A sorting domain-containing protein [Balneola sp.]